MFWTWNFTVRSLMFNMVEISQFVFPSLTQCMISFSRSESGLSQRSRMSL